MGKPWRSWATWVSCVWAMGELRKVWVSCVSCGWVERGRGCMGELKEVMVAWVSCVSYGWVERGHGCMSELCVSRGWVKRGHELYGGVGCEMGMVGELWRRCGDCGGYMRAIGWFWGLWRSYGTVVRGWGLHVDCMVGVSELWGRCGCKWGGVVSMRRCGLHGWLCGCVGELKVSMWVVVMIVWWRWGQKSHERRHVCISRNWVYKISKWNKWRS